MPSKSLLEELANIRKERFGQLSSGHFKPFQSDPDSYANNVMKKPHEHFIDNSVFAYYLFQQFKTLCHGHPKFEQLLTNIDSVNDRTIFLLQNKVSRKLIEDIVDQMMMSNEDCSDTPTSEFRRSSMPTMKMPTGKVPTKDINTANEERMNGNKYFKNKEYDKALECYNMAILKCPTSKNFLSPSTTLSSTKSLIKPSPKKISSSPGADPSMDTIGHKSFSSAFPVIDIDPLLPVDTNPLPSDQCTQNSSSSRTFPEHSSHTSLNGMINENKNDDDDHKFDSADQSINGRESSRTFERNDVDIMDKEMNGTDGKGMNHETLLSLPHDESSRSCSCSENGSKSSRTRGKEQECCCMMDDRAGIDKESQDIERKEKQKKEKVLELRADEKNEDSRKVLELDKEKNKKTKNGFVIKDNYCDQSTTDDDASPGDANTDADTDADAKMGDAIFPLLLANRSAVYLHLKNFSDAICDIDESIALGYQILDNHNIVTRKITCLKFLGRDADAERLYKDMIQLINREITSERVRLFWVEKLTQSLNQIVPVINAQASVRENVNLVGANEILPSASDFVYIDYSSDKGRHLKVAKDVSVGEILIIDRPIGSVLANKFYDNYCNHCMVQLTNCRFIPCFNCNLVKFCSINCRNESWKSYHRVECACLESLRLYPNGLHLLRILISCNIDNCIRISLSTPPAQSDYAKLGMRRDYNSFNSLLPKIMDSPEFLICYPLASAIYGLISLRMSMISKSDLIIFSSKTVINSLLKISRNADTIFTADFNLIIGSAVHTTSAMFNHDCDPNVYSYYVGNKVVHVAKKPIKTNCEINVSYGVNYAFDPLNERQEFLLKSFLFECNCGRCSAEKIGSKNCKSCHGSLMRTTFDTIACPNCDVTNDPNDSMLLDPDHFLNHNLKNCKNGSNGGGTFTKSSLLNWSIFNYCSIM